MWSMPEGSGVMPPNVYRKAPSDTTLCPYLGAGGRPADAGEISVQVDVVGSKFKRSLRKSAKTHGMQPMIGDRHNMTEESVFRAQKELQVKESTR